MNLRAWYEDRALRIVLAMAILVAGLYVALPYAIAMQSVGALASLIIAYAATNIYLSIKSCIELVENKANQIDINKANNAVHQAADLIETLNQQITQVDVPQLNQRAIQLLDGTNQTLNEVNQTLTPVREAACLANTYGTMPQRFWGWLFNYGAAQPNDSEQTETPSNSPTP